MVTSFLNTKVSRQYNHWQVSLPWYGMPKEQSFSLSSYSSPLETGNSKSFSTTNKDTFCSPVTPLTFCSWKCLDQSLVRAAILFFWSAQKHQLYKVEDVEIKLPILFHIILFRGCREVKNVSTNQRPGQPSWFSDRPKTHKVGRELKDVTILLPLKYHQILIICCRADSLSCCLKHQYFRNTFDAYKYACVICSAVY